MKVIHAALCTENRQAIKITKPQNLEFQCNPARRVQNSRNASPFRRAIPDKGKTPNPSLNIQFSSMPRAVSEALYCSVPSSWSMIPWCSAALCDL